MPRSTSSLAALTALTLTALSACDSTGPDTGATQVFLSQGAVAASAPALAGALFSDASVASAYAPPVRDQLASIMVTVTGVDALRTGGEEQGGWVSLEITTPVALDLLQLPTSSENALLLARGDLAAGTYGNLRIRFSDVFVTFSEEVRVGQAVYPADESIAVFVPSGAEVGIRVPGLTFTVGEETGAEIGLLFDPEGTAATIVATGADRILMTPVLRGKP